MKRNWLILAAIAVSVLQIGFLSWSIAGRASVLRDGQEVLLKVEPVDPRDLLRGDYVRLGYSLAALPRSLFAEGVTDDDFVFGRTVYALLRRGEGGVYSAAAAAFDRDKLTTLGTDEAVIRGTVTGSRLGEGGLGADVDYGIERFYLPEGEGRQIEKDMRERPFFVVAAVADDGAAQIKRFLDGETVLYDEPYY